MNLPNKLTVLRIFMIPVFMLIIVFVPNQTVACLTGAAVFGLTSLTDMLDGKIARKYNLITDFGKFLDPLADKFMVLGALLSILVRFPEIESVLVWALAIVIFRELAVTSLRLLANGSGGVVIAANFLGKAKTVTQIACILTLLLEPLLPHGFSQYHILSYATIAAMSVMTVWSGVNYFRSYSKYIDPRK